MITSVSNSRVKRIVQLQEKTKVRNQENVFIIEGSKLFLEAPEAMIREVYLTEGFLGKYLQPEVKNKLDGFSCEMVSEEVFCKISDTKSPQGILCVLQQSTAELSDILGRKGEKAPFFLLLEDIQDPGNLGTILRTGEGAGIDGIIMSRGCVDIYNPKTIRSTMGSIFRVPFVYTDNLVTAMGRLQEAGIKIYAAHLQGACEYDQCDYDSGAAFLIGNEGNGLKEETAKNADVNIKIPMEGKVESLNAAAATAVLLYEAYQQRRNQEAKV